MFGVARGTIEENNTHSSPPAATKIASRSELSSSLRDHADYPSQEGTHRGDPCLGRASQAEGDGASCPPTLEEEHGVVRQTGRSRTNLQEWTVKLNKAGTKKSVLVASARRSSLSH